MEGLKSRESQVRSRALSISAPTRPQVAQGVQSEAAQRGRGRVEDGLQAMLTAGITFPMDPAAKEGLANQLAHGLRMAITAGRLQPGTRLPSTRALSQVAGVSRNVVLASFGALMEEGLITGKHGSGSFVADRPKDVQPSRPVPDPEPEWLRRLASFSARPQTKMPVVDARLRQRPAATVPARAWRHAWQSAAMRRIRGYHGDPAGEELLRDGLAGFVSHSRGLQAAKGDVVVTNGAVDALTLLLSLVVLPGEWVAFEDPGYPSAHHVARAHGAKVATVPVDSGGLSVEALEQLDPAPRLVHLTPSHQFPTGVVMGTERRRQLLAWAFRNDALIIDNDFGGEFSSGSVPLATDDAVGVVAYVGTLSCLLTPSLRIGYVIAPRPLAVHIARHKHATDSYTSFPVQMAVTELLATGDLRRHLRRARRIVAEQRKTIAAALPTDSFMVSGLSSGLHIHIPLPDSASEETVTERLIAKGVLVDRLSFFFTGQPTAAGLLVDYAGLSEAELERLVSTLRAALT